MKANIFKIWEIKIKNGTLYSSLIKINLPTESE